MRVLLLVATTLVVGGCSAIADFVSNLNPPIVRLEVWNRTLDDATLTDRNGKRLEVPACGHAIAETFRVDLVRVHTTVGYVFGFASGGEGRRQYLVLVPGQAESFPSATQPTTFRPCLDHLDSQPGVFLDP